MQSLSIKHLAIAKFALLLAGSVSYFGVVKFKEKSLIAQSAKPTDAKDPATLASSDEKDPNQQKSRKSYITDLLELPELDTSKAAKADLGKFIEIASRKERQVTERLDLLKKREAQIKQLEKSVEEKITILDEERKFFAQSIQKEKDLKNERTAQLIPLYAKMEPKKAAPVFEKLDRDLVVELFKQLPQKQITAILEAMPPDRSVALSEYFGRVRSAKEYDLLKEMNQSLRKEFDDCKGMPSQSANSQDPSL
jgi:flagellar motility protein MotE (MotC chaperone)